MHCPMKCNISTFGHWTVLCFKTEQDDFVCILTFSVSSAHKREEFILNGFAERSLKIQNMTLWAHYTFYIPVIIFPLALKEV